MKINRKILAVIMLSFFTFSESPLQNHLIPKMEKSQNTPKNITKEQLDKVMDSLRLHWA